MKILIKYPKTNSELHRFINFIDSEFKKIQTYKNEKEKARSWMRLCQASNDILKKAKEESSKSNKKLSIFFLSENHDLKVANIIENWMKTNKFPIW